MSNPRPTPHIWDLAVVGAGPAGSVCAYVAARRGLRVALIDQRNFPRDKSCGDGIGPGGEGVLLDRLGLSELLAGEQPIAQVCIIGPGGTTVHSEVPTLDGKPLHGYVIARSTFDHRLFTAALKAGATDFSNHKLIGWGKSSDPEYRELSLRHDDQEIMLRCRVLVGADGPYSTVRRMISAPPHPKRHTMLAMRAYATLEEDFDPRLIFEFHEELLPGYGWIFPDGKGSANVGVAQTLVEAKGGNTDIRSLLESFVARSRKRGIPLGEVSRHRSHHLPLAASAPRLAYDRAVLVGDSAAMINPMSGEGIVYAMTSAAELAQRLPVELTDAGALATGLRGYQDWYRDMYRGHMRVNFWLRKIISRPKVAARMMRRLQRNPAAMNAVTELIFNTGRSNRHFWWRSKILWQALRTLRCR